MSLIGSLNPLSGSSRYQPAPSRTPSSTGGSSFQASLAGAASSGVGASAGGTAYLSLTPQSGLDTLKFYLNNYVKGSAPLSPSINNAQLGAFASQFDLDNMTEETLDQFLDALVETGLFSRDDLRAIFYGDMCYDENSPTCHSYMTHPGQGVSTLFGTDLELQEWAGVNSTLLYGWTTAEGHQQPMFLVDYAEALRTLMPILEQMAARQG